MRIVRNHKVIGVLFLVMMLVMVWLTYAVFTKKFADYDEVTLTTSKIGLQMPERADVKYRGMIVGEVLEFEPTRDGAELTLGLYPDQVDKIPAGVTGSIVPKTLFGEKYVALEPTAPLADGHIEAGDHIERTEVGTEVEQVLSDLYPLLRSIKPDKLNYTLNALATALEGRGDEIAGGLRTLDSYLKRFNPHLDDLVGDLRKTAEVSDLYNDVLPEIATILRNTVKTTGTLQEKEDQLRALFGDVTAFSRTAQAFLEANESNIIQLGELSVAQLEVLAHYAPEYPCLIGGIRNLVPREDDIFRGHVLHIDLQILPNQPRGYAADDRPKNIGRLPAYCGTLPTPPHDQKNPFTKVPHLDDGIERPTGKGTDRAATGFGELFVGTGAESALLRALLAPGTGRPNGEVPDVALLLFGPIARGGEVSYQ